MIDKKKVAAALGDHYLWFLPCCEACHDMRHSSCAGAGVCEDFGRKWPPPPNAVRGLVRRNSQLPRLSMTTHPLTQWPQYQC